MKRPAFQFYPADYTYNVKLRRCSWEAKGVWVQILCLFHDNDEYGLLRWTLDEIALAVGCPIEYVQELVTKDVLKGSDKDGDKVSFSTSFSQKNKPPISVTLLSDEPSPVWYSSRMVRDEYMRVNRGKNGAKSLENPNVPRKKETENEGENEPKKDEKQSIDKDTFSPSPTSSSSSSNKDLKEYLSSDDDIPPPNNVTPIRPKNPPIPYDAIFDLYDEIVAKPFNRPHVRLRNDKRKRLIKKIWDIGAKTKTLEWWREYFERVTENDGWMQGRQFKDGFWKGANFDFLLREDNFLKVVE